MPGAHNKKHLPFQQMPFNISGLFNFYLFIPTSIVKAQPVCNRNEGKIDCRWSTLNVDQYVGFVFAQICGRDMLRDKNLAIGILSLTLISRYSLNYFPLAERIVYLHILQKVASTCSPMENGKNGWWNIIVLFGRISTWVYVRFVTSDESD